MKVPTNLATRFQLLPVPREWTEHGYVPAHSPKAPRLCFHDDFRPSSCPPNTNNSSWTVPVAQVLFGAPVVAADGTIVVGNLAGALIAVTPDGHVKWTRNLNNAFLGSTIVSSTSTKYLESYSLLRRRPRR